MKYLPGRNAVRGRPVLLDNINRHRFPAPGMVDDEFCINAKDLIEQGFKDRIKGCPGNISQREQLHRLQSGCDTAADPPEIRQRSVRPKNLSETHLVQFSYADAVLVGFGFLGNDIHGHLGKEQIRADTGRSRDAGVVEHIAYHRHGHLMGGHAVGAQVVGHVNEHLVNGIHDPHQYPCCP